MSDCIARRPGTDHGYTTDGCRCPSCRAGHMRYQKAYRLSGQRRRVSAVGSTRRIHALVALGWPMQAIADAAGWKSMQAVWLITRRPMISTASARRVAAAYDQLSMAIGPSNLARLRAARNGWPPPLAFDDDTIDDPAAERPGHDEHTNNNCIDRVAIERVLAGEQLVLTRAERLEVVRRLLHAGHGSAEVGRVLHASGDTARQLLEEAAA